MKKSSILIAVTALSAMLTGCGGGNMGNVNQVYLAASQAQNQTANKYLYAAPPQIQTNGTAQASAGGRAVATSGGYVYEQNAAANSAGYSYYNAQNPCLYPVAGQAVNCGTSANGANSGYYTGQQPVYQTNPQASSSYGSGYAVTPGGNGAVAPQTSSYGAVNPAASSYGTATQANPYASTPTAANPYGTTPASSTNPYGTGASTPSTYTGQSATQMTDAERARARIATNAPAASGSTSTGKKGTSF